MSQPSIYLINQQFQHKSWLLICQHNFIRFNDSWAAAIELDLKQTIDENTQFKVGPGYTWSRL